MTRCTSLHNYLHHVLLRLCLDDVYTSHVESLYTEANEPPYMIVVKNSKSIMEKRLFAIPSNPVYGCVIQPPITDFYENHQNYIQNLDASNSGIKHKSSSILQLSLLYVTPG